jgi:hypothetical protein
LELVGVLISQRTVLTQSFHLLLQLAVVLVVVLVVHLQQVQVLLEVLVEAERELIVALTTTAELRHLLAKETLVVVVGLILP